MTNTLIFLIANLFTNAVFAAPTPSEDVAIADVEQLFDFVEFQLRNNDFDGARKTLRMILAANPNNTKAKEWLFGIGNLNSYNDLVLKAKLFSVVKSQMEGDNFIEARKTFVSILKLDPANAWVKEQIINIDASLKLRTWQLESKFYKEAKTKITSLSISPFERIAIDEVGTRRTATLMIMCANSESMIKIYHGINNSTQTTLKVTFGNGETVALLTSEDKERTTLDVLNPEMLISNLGGQTSMFYEFTPQGFSPVTLHFDVTGWDAKFTKFKKICGL